MMKLKLETDQVRTVKDRILKIAKTNHAKVVAIRRYLHANPELSFKEEKTAAYISEQLSDLGIPHKTGIGGNGISGSISGSNPLRKVVALRADFDALPIQEMNDIEYKSKNNGVMHACGHDAHTASLLGTLMILNEMKDKFEGSIKFIFQPAEEKFPGGAQLMIDDGVLEDPKPDLILGQHVYPDLETGHFGFRTGKYMASADEVYIKIKGKGGHAAIPHDLVDPILIAAHFITAVQQLVSRNTNPVMETVVSFGRVSAEGATNVIPDHVMLEGTIRTMDEEWRNEVHKKITRLANGLAESMGGSCDIEIIRGYPYLQNDNELTTEIRYFASEFLPDGGIVEIPPRMGAEDFAFYSQQIPACFYRFGTSNRSKGIVSGLHTPTFNIDESSLETSAALMAWLAYRELVPGRTE